MHESAEADIARRLAACAVFDLDGTLIDTAPTHEWAINEALTDNGAAPISPTAIRRCIGHGPAWFVERALQHAFGPELLTLDPAIQESIQSAFTDRLTSKPTRHATTRELGPELLAAVHSSGGTVGVCTNKPQHLAHRVLAGVGLLDMIDVVVGGDAVANPKPAPDPLLYCVDLLGSNPADTVFVGDSSIDLATGAAAGVPVVLITGGYEPGDEPTHAPLAIDGLDELLDLLPLRIGASS